MLHVNDLTVISGGRGNGGGDAGKKAAKPVSTVQDWILTFLSMKPLDIWTFLRRPWNKFKPCLWQQKKNNI